MEKGEKILQIFESSACLKADQMLGYLNGNLFQEELRVVELHLASCNLCQEALEGLENHADAKALIDSLTVPALPSVEKKTASIPEPSSVAKNIFPSSSKKNHTIPSLPKSTFTAKNHSQISRQRNMSWLGIGGIAALLLLGGFLFWQYENSRLDWKSFSIASNDVKEPAITDSNITNNDSAKTAGTKSRMIAKKPTTTPITSTPDSAKKTAATVTIKTKPADSTVTMVATASEVRNSKTLADNAGKITKDSQNNSEQNNTVAAVTPPKAEPKTKTAVAKPTTKPVETSVATESLGSSDYQTGKSLFQKKQYASALLYLRSAAENNNDPHHVEAMYYSGLCNLQIGKTGRAKRLFKKVEKSDSPFAVKASEQLKQL